MSVATAKITKVQPEVENSVSKIVRKHVLTSMGIGIIPIPFLDIAGITAINIRMISKISRRYGDTFNKQIATNVITSLVSSMGAKGAANGVLGSLVKSIPFIGGVAWAVTYPAVAGATTYALGQVFIRHYEAGGTLLTLDSDSVKEYFNEQYDKGKTRVKEVKDAALGKTKK